MDHYGWTIVRYRISRISSLVRTLLTSIALLLFSVICYGQTTYPATDCSAAAIQQAVNNEINAAADGDIIAIPAGNCVWTGTQGVSGTFTTSVTIQGAGAISATTSGAGTTGTDVTTITDQVTGNSHVLMSFNSPSPKTFRLTGIAFIQNTSSVATGLGMVTIGGTTTAARIDHCHFYSQFTGNKGLHIGILGVADHIFFDALTGIITNDLSFENGGNWLGTDPTGNADTSWTDTDHFGTSQFFFVEDTRFNQGWVSDCAVGGRYVIRNSTMISVGGIANHGLNPGRVRGCRAAEIYNNTFTATQANQNGGSTYSNNSGAAIYWGNTSTWYRTMVGMDITRKNNQPYTMQPTPTGWGYCGTNFSGTGSNWDGNILATNGVPCMDQPGRGAGDRISGAFPNVVNQTTNTITWPHEALDPLYVFANTYNPAGFGSDAIMAASNTLFTDNQDFYQQYLPTYGEPGSNCTTSPCNITAGVNQATRAPVNGTDTCVAGTDPKLVVSAPGVGWWNSATSTLYVCNPTNTWSVYYTPFTYPHPLVTGGGLVTVSPASINFGNQVVGVASAAQTVTVTNNTTNSVTMNTPYFTITGTNAADFTNVGSLTNPCLNGAVLSANGGTCLTAITFTPSAAGARGPASLTINTNANSPTVSLTGVGTQAVLSISPSSLAFGNINVGSTSTAQTVTLTNTGTTTLTGLFGNQVLSDLTNYAIINNACSSTLAANGGTCTIQVQFKPTVQGSLPATLTFFTNASNSPTSIPISGTGIITGNPCGTGQVCGITIKGGVKVVGGIVTVQ